MTGKGMVTDTKKDAPFWVRNYDTPPDEAPPIKMEVSLRQTAAARSHFLALLRNEHCHCWSYTAALCTVVPALVCTLLGKGRWLNTMLLASSLVALVMNAYCKVVRHTTQAAVLGKCCGVLVVTAAVWGTCTHKHWC